MPSGDEFTQRDIAFHRDTAASYDEEITEVYSVYHRYLLEPYIDRLRAVLSPPRRALDVGCGTGVVSIVLANRDFEVTGIDHSEEMLAIAREKAVREGVIDRCTFLTGDVRDLPFGDGEFDCVTCQGLLHHLEDIEPCVREMARVLRSGGALYISEPTSDRTPAKRVLEGVWQLMRRRGQASRADADGPATVEAPIEVNELEAALREVGIGYDTTFLTHLPPARRLLSDRSYLTVVRVISYLWRNRQGDLVFVFGRKGSRTLV
jgi:ubiquinone/menaquinone biosynthesis C-methylase UbiE